MSVKLLTEHHLEFLSLKGGCTGASESTLVKMPHCWKSQSFIREAIWNPTYIAMLINYFGKNDIILDYIRYLYMVGYVDKPVWKTYKKYPKKSRPRGAFMTGDAILINLFGRMVLFYNYLYQKMSPRRMVLEGHLSQVKLCMYVV